MRYIGKDIVTPGSALVLDPELAWERLGYGARRAVRRALRAGVTTRFSRDLEDVARVIYDRRVLPERLQDEQTIIVAELQGEVVAAIVMTPTTPNTLFCHFGGVSERGREVEAQSRLFWAIVEHFEDDSRFEFLDVGVSFRPPLQFYFQKFCTHPYPIVFNPPDQGLRPRIGIAPSDASALDPDTPPADLVPFGYERLALGAVDDVLSEFFGRPFSYTPDGQHALRAALEVLEIGPADVVTIRPTFRSDCALRRVTEAIAGRCPWSMDLEPRTKAIVVIHEWGVCHPEIEQIVGLGYPVVEDCAYSVDSLGPDGRRVGSFGALAVYGLSEVFPSPYGGLLVGHAFSDREMWDRVQCLDVAKRDFVRRMLATHWPLRQAAASRRRHNWDRLDRWVRMAGLEPSFECDDATVPGVYLFRPRVLAPGFVRDRLADFGVECGIDHDNGAVFVPCHQRLSDVQIDYIFAAFRGALNLCYTFQRGDEVHLDENAAA